MNLNANYEISGDIVTPTGNVLTGNGSGIFQVPVTLTTGDGVKIISRILEAQGHKTLTGTTSIILDTTIPTPPAGGT